MIRSKIIKYRLKDSNLQKVLALIGQQINVLLDEAEKNGLLDVRQADILIKYAKFLSDLDEQKTLEAAKLKKLSPAAAKKLLDKELRKHEEPIDSE
jgi:hypothetical protein